MNPSHAPLLALAACSSGPRRDFDLHVAGPTLERHSVPAFGGIVAVDGARIAAADVDGDRVEVRNLVDDTSRWVVLPEGTVPGPIAFADGVLHVLGRASGRLYDVDTTQDGPLEVLAQTPVCDAPRGVAVDRWEQRTWVACADGQLVGVDATEVIRHRLPPDLRDVVALGGGRALVSRFRTAEVLLVDLETGAVESRRDAPTTQVGVQSRVARRMVAYGDGALLAYQEEADPLSGAEYYAPEASTVGTTASTVGTTVTEIGPNLSTGDVLTQSSSSLQIDLTAGPAGVYGAGTGIGDNQVFAYGGESPDFGTAAVVSGVAVALDGRVFAATRSPYALVDIDEGEPAAVQPGGLALFQQAPEGVACASCHPDGGEDAHVWNTPAGLRKTLPLGGGVLDTAPFHWDGALDDLEALYTEVGVGRMALPPLTGDELDAFAAWLDDLPVAPIGPAPDEDAVARGGELFARADVGCTACHVPPTYTSPGSHDVGTGGAMQVPSLRSVSVRLPVMHDGCAKTLRQRFDRVGCGGGDAHGHTSQLSDADLDDLVAFLSSL